MSQVLPTVDIDHPASVTLGDDPTTLVTAATAGGAIREQDSAVHDPNDPNLATYPERLHKLYFSVTGGTIKVIFSADGVTWGSPQSLTGLGSNVEDPCVCTLFSTPGEVYRDGSGLMYMYVEYKVNDANLNTVFVYSSTDGIAWTSMANNPAIPRGAAASYDEDYSASPTVVFDGSQFIVIYESINSPNETMSIAYGAAADVLTKSPNNPVWDESFSIVIDTVFKNAAEDRVIMLGHDGGSPKIYNIWRASSAVMDPTQWASGDVALLGSPDVSPIRCDFTAMFPDDNKRRVITTDASDNLIVTRLVGGAPIVRAKAAGAFSRRVTYVRVGGAWLRDRSELAAWWDFSDASSVTLSGSEITQANDKSGNSRHMTQATSANRPTLTGTIGGLGAAVFDGVNDYMDSSAFSMLQQITFYVVATFDGGTSPYLFDSPTGGRMAMGQRIITAGQLGIFAGGTTVTAAYTIPATTPKVYTAVFNGASSAIYIDGALFDTGNAGSQTVTGGIRLGASQAFFAGTYFNGKMSTVLVYRGAHSAADVAAITADLSATYGTA